MSGSLATPLQPPTTARLATRDRVLIGLGFLVTTILTSLAGFYTQDRAAECQAIRSQRLTDVNNFRSVAMEFEPLVAAYMGAALRGQNAEAAKKAVVLNLRNQRARLTYVVPYLDADGAVAAKRFETAAINFVVESGKNPTGVNVGPLYQELNYIFANSQDLVDASNRATGMKAGEVSSVRFLKRTISCSDT